MVKALFNSWIGFFQHRLARSIGLIFAIDSLMFGSWVTHIPQVKRQLGLDESQLGIALFGLPLGLLLMNPVSPKFIARFGLGRTTLGSILLVCGTMALPSWTPSLWWLFGALVLNGMCVAVVNVAMNTCATTVERSMGIPITSTCHGMWSLGGLAGSATSAVLIGAGVAAHLHLSVLALAASILVLKFIKPALRELPEHTAPAEVALDVAAEAVEAPRSGIIWPNRDLRLMIFIGLCVGLSEGVAFDWSGVYLREHLGAQPSVAALAFTGFSLAMMAVRFSGDVIIPRIGERRILFGLLGASITGLLVLVFSPNPAFGIAGFFLLGAGVGLGAPILFNAAARIPGLAPGAGLATYATFSFAGFLIGPPAIGFLGGQLGLPAAFCGVVGLLILAVPAVGRVNLYL